MSLRDWAKTAKYARKLVHEGCEGAAIGAESALHGTELIAFLHQSIRTAMIPAALGACVGLVRVLPARRRSAAQTLRRGLLGGAAAFAVAVAWHTRELASSAGSRAWQSVSRERDQHWLERHPIDYA